MRCSELHGKDVYTTKGRHIGKIYNIILDMQEGKIVRLTLVPINNISSKDEAVEIIKKNSIRFDRVVSMGDIILVEE